MKVVIVGAGPAGLTAAASARQSGAQVLLVDDNPGIGGQIWRGSKNPADEKLQGVQVITGAQVISADAASQELFLETAERSVKIRYGKLILATGARELFLPFPGWTLPGIMGVGGLQALVKTGLPVAGKKIVVAGSGPLSLAVAAYLKRRRARILLIAEQAPLQSIAKFAGALLAHPSKAVQGIALKLNLLSVPYRTGCWIEAAEGTDCVRSVRLRQGCRTWTVNCDFAAVSYGLVPNTELAALLGCSFSKTGVAVDDYQQTTVANVYCAGESTGIGGVDLSIAEGAIAGYAAADDQKRCLQLFSKRRRAQRFAALLNSSFALRSELRHLAQDDTVVCRCEDVTYGLLKRASSFREAKLQMRCGMGPCQGRICGAATEFLFAWKTDSIRPPVLPARIGSLTLANSVE